MGLLILKINSELDCQTKVDALKSAISFINGGAFDYDAFLSNIKDITHGLLRGAHDLRSSLVKHSCLLITLLAQVLQSKNVMMVELIPSLSKQTQHGTLIIAESSKLAILKIAHYCQNNKIITQLIDLATSKAIKGSSL
jgi:hypothetical protein